MMRAASGKQRLEPFLSPAGVWAYGVGTAVGWGSLVVTSNGYLLEAGPAGSLVGLILGSLVMLVVARNYSHLMNRYPDSGGSYTYVRHVLGNDHGFLLAWFLVLTYMAVFWANVTSLPLFSRFFLGGFFEVGYLYTIFGYDVYLGEVLLTMGAIIVLGALCTSDKRMKQRLMIALVTLLTAGISFCFIASVVLHGAASPLFSPAFIPDKDVVVQMAAVALMTPWAFIGFESVSHSTEEFAFSRTKSFRILLAVVITVALLYAFVVGLSATAYPDRYDSWFAYLSDLGNCTGIEGLPPFYAAYRYLGDAGLGILMASLLALVLTSLIGNLVALSRLFVTLARDGVVPERFSHLNSKGTPSWIIIVITVVSLFIPFLGRTPIGWIVDITTIGACIVYGFVSFAEYRIGRTEDNREKITLGLIGTGAMALFAAATVIPSLIWQDSLASETYLLLTIWSIIGFVYFRYLLYRDEERQYGNSMVVWVLLLALVMFASTVWMQKSDLEMTNHVIATIEGHLEENLSGLDLSTERQFIELSLQELRDDNVRSSMITVGMFAVAMGMMMSNYRYMRRRQDAIDHALGAARQAAFIDPLTGVKSKNAFVEWERKIDAELADGELEALSVVVCDVNGLKFINDTYGHKAGDEYIKKACSIVCSHFKRSHIFRIGGDEFVVIPQGDDLQAQHEILESFDREVEGNIGTTEAVISAGLSWFRPGLDRNFHDIFERADARMYQRKMQLKNMGAATRD